jgi:hypothetical protein
MMFTRNDLLRFLNAMPFVPFRLYLSDGGFIDIRHRELVQAGRRFAIIGIPNPNDPEAVLDDFIIVAYLHMTRAQSLAPGRPPGEDATPPGPSESPAPTPA